MVCCRQTDSSGFATSTLKQTVVCSSKLYFALSAKASTMQLIPKMLQASMTLPSQWWLLAEHSLRVLYALLRALLPGSPAFSRKLTAWQEQQLHVSWLCYHNKAEERYSSTTYCDMRCSNGSAGWFFSTEASAVCRTVDNWSILSWQAMNALQRRCSDEMTRSISPNEILHDISKALPGSLEVAVHARFDPDGTADIRKDSP